RVDPVGLVGGGSDRRGRVAAGQGDELAGGQIEVVSGLERRQRRGRVDEFSRRRQHHVTATGNIRAEIREGRQTVLLRQILTDRHAPGVVGGRGCQPDQPV